MKKKPDFASTLLTLNEFVSPTSYINKNNYNKDKQKRMHSPLMLRCIYYHSPPVNYTNIINITYSIKYVCIVYTVKHVKNKTCEWVISVIIIVSPFCFEFYFYI